TPTRNRPPAFADGRRCRRQFMGHDAFRLQPSTSRLGLTVRGRRRTLFMLCHELVELFLVLGVTQAIEEIAEFALLFFQPPEGFHAVLIERAVAARRRTERKTAAFH